MDDHNRKIKNKNIIEALLSQKKKLIQIKLIKKIYQNKNVHDSGKKCFQSYFNKTLTKNKLSS